MHLVKWIRKNMTKLMAIFVILIMVAFVVPQLLTQLARPKYQRADTAHWLYGENEKITLNDIKTATNELKILSGLYTDKMFYGQQDLKMMLLGHMLFGQSVPGYAVSDQVKMLKSKMRIQVSDRKIDEFFRQTTGKSELLWILLKAEAKRSGCAISVETAGAVLKDTIPKITNGVSAAEVVKNISASYHVTENQVLQIFADAMLVATYAGIVAETEDVTESQMESVFANQFNAISATAVVFNADSFLANTAEPASEAIAATFEKYKNVYAGQSSDDNPYGFGYKLAPRVQLEYIIIKYSDVAGLVAKPSEHELERYYQANLEQFTEQVKKDSQDPNSEMVSQQKSYAEVSSAIRSLLLNRRIVSKCSVIINEVIDMAEENFSGIDFADAKAEDLKARAGSYIAAAAKIKAKYGIAVAVGKTGLVSPEQLQRNPVFGSLKIQGQSRVPATLSKVVFAIDELGVTELSIYEALKPRVYLSIGPLFGGYGQPAYAAAARVVGYAEASAADSVDYKYEKNLLSLDLTVDTADNVVSVREQVIKDLKRVEAMQIAKAKAAEFIAEFGTSEDWDKAAESFRAAAAGDYPDISVSVQKLNFARQDISAAETASEDMPLPELYLSQIKQYNGLVDVIQSKFEMGKEKPRTLPLLIEYKPFRVYYCIKDMSCKYGSVDEYNQLRGNIAFSLDSASVQAFIFDHYMPDNINKRMNFKVVEQPSESLPDSNDASEANGEN